MSAAAESSGEGDKKLGKSPLSSFDACSLVMRGLEMLKGEEKERRGSLRAPMRVPLWGDDVIQCKMPRDARALYSIAFAILLRCRM